jgi:PAS domain S-box-containing protein
MAIPLRVLVLEDRAADAELVLYELRQAGFDPDWQRVETEPDYLAHLAPGFDIILADYTLPQFDALRALHLLQERGLDIPLIVVTGSINEEVAVECIKKGAADYLLKDRLARLGQVVTRALENKQLRIERKQAEEALRASEERYHLANHATFNAIWDWNLQTDAVWWNENFQTLFGYRAEEIEPGLESWTTRIHPEDLERVKTGIHAAIDAGRQPWSDCYRFRRKDGTYAEIDDRGYISRDSNGNPARMIGAMQDISEQKRAEEALRKSEQLLRTSADNIPALVSYLDQDRCYRFVNQRYAENFGKPLEALVGKPYRDIVGEAYYQATLKNVNAAFSGQRISYETSIDFPGIGTHWVIVTYTPDIDAQGHLKGIFVVAYDITDRKRAEEERERLLTELAQKNNELEQLVYVTSHDLRSPLVNVQGFSKELQHTVQDLAALLQSPEVPEHLRAEATVLVEKDIQEDLQYILTGIAKMDALLSGLLKLSRLGRAALTITTLDLNKLIMNMRNTFAFQIQEAGVNLEVSELPSCKGDATQINQVFSNLVDNALKYLDPNRPGVIKIWGYTENPQAIYCVEDNGIGIAPEHQQNIFEIFHRLNPSEGTGEGLGLTIVRRVLERQGGNVWVESEPGKGSKFYVALPRG